MMGLRNHTKVAGAQLVPVMPWLPTPSGEMGLQSNNVSAEQGVTSKEKLRLHLSRQTRRCTEAKQAHPSILPKA